MIIGIAHHDKIIANNTSTHRVQVWLDPDSELGQMIAALIKNYPGMNIEDLVNEGADIYIGAQAS